MAEMLSYRGSRSTASVFENTNRIEYADENYAREVMQLFSIGLYSLHSNGTRTVDAAGRFVETYTNDDISEYARVWTGFLGQSRRGNIEDPSFREYYTTITRGGIHGTKADFSLSPTGQNRVDPMRVNLRFRDNMPKVSPQSVWWKVVVGDLADGVNHRRWVLINGTLATGCLCAQISEIDTFSDRELRTDY